MTTAKSDVEATDWKWFRFLLVIAAPLGYALAYTYERGYCDVFEIPKELIVLNWTTILIGVSAALAGSFILMWFIVMLLLPGKPGKQMGPIRGRLYFFSLMLALTLFVTLRYLIFEELIYAIVFVVVLFIALFIMPIFDKSARKKKGYRKKLKAYDKTRTEIKEPLLRHFGLKEALLIILLVGSLLFSYLEGRAQAINQDEFYIPSTHTNSVVLRIYGDSIICAPVASKARGEIERAFFILKTNDEPRPLLISTRTGRLHIKHIEETPQ
jgi:hypothetical protein